MTPREDLKRSLGEVLRRAQSPSLPQRGLTAGAALLRHAGATLALGWCQFCQAADQYGEAVPVLSDLACVWCPLGAIDRAAAVSEASIEADVAVAAAKTALAIVCSARLDRWRDRMNWQHIPDYCDAAGRRQEEILSAVTGAAALLEDARGYAGPLF